MIDNKNKISLQQQKRFKALEEGTFFARDLVSEPGNILHPDEYAKRINRLKKDGLKINIYDETKLKKLGMNALLGVGQGSIRGSYLVTMDERELLPGILPILKFLKANNQKIALGSASKNARPILEKTGILNYFDAIVDGNDVTNAKPDPEVFLQAARKLGIENENSIVFEDSVAGIQAANSAKMISIGIGEKEILFEANYIFEDSTQIGTEFIKKLIN